jgi:hypothetical protein
MIANGAVAAGDTVGSSMYGVLPEHTAALVAVALVPLAFWWARPGPDLDASRKLVVWLLTASAAVHVGLALGHEPSFLTILFVFDAVALAAIVHRLLTGRSWRGWAAALLVASILFYAGHLVAGHPPDQVGLATRLGELTALAVVLTPVATSSRRLRLRRLVGSTVTVSLFVVTGLAAWIGGFVVAEPESGDAAASHHGGAMPAPGTAMRPHVERDPTPAETAAADRFYEAFAGAMSDYADPRVAGADGFEVDGMTGTDFHAVNPAHQHDGRIFDPARPENLVYAVTPSGPVLLGAMFEMPRIGVPGPEIGGPLTPWHEHENVCFSPIPPTLPGFLSPFGLCPPGSVVLPRTPEMIHVWVVPGAPQRFGDLDEEWLADYLASLG